MVMDFFVQFDVLLHYVSVNELANDIQNSCKLLCEWTYKNVTTLKLKIYANMTFK